MRFLSNFGCKLIFMCSVNFWHQQDSNSSFKGSIGNVTPKCQWHFHFFSFFFLFFEYFAHSSSVINKNF